MRTKQQPVKTMNQPYTVRTLARIVSLKGKSQYDESASIITKADEGAGEFIKIEQPSQPGEVLFTREEWEVVKATVDMMFQEIELEEKEGQRNEK